MEALLVKLATSAGGAGVALAAMYFVYKMDERRKARRMNDIASDPAPNPGNPAMLGGSNPAGDERSGVSVIPDGERPITREHLKAHCTAVHAVSDEKFDAINKSLGDTNTKIDKMETKLDKNAEAMMKSVADLQACTAVLKDRTNNRRD
jgi:hypothetical protein